MNRKNGFVATYLGGPQGLLLTLCSGITPDRDWGTVCGTEDPVGVDMQGRCPNLCILSAQGKKFFKVLQFYRYSLFWLQIFYIGSLNLIYSRNIQLHLNEVLIL